MSHMSVSPTLKNSNLLYIAYMNLHFFIFMLKPLTLTFFGIFGGGFLATHWCSQSLEGLCVSCNISMRLYVREFLRLKWILREQSYSILVLIESEVEHKLISIVVTISFHRPHKPYMVSNYTWWVLDKEFLPKMLYEWITKESLSKLLGVFIENLE